MKGMALGVALCVLLMVCYVLEPTSAQQARHLGGGGHPWYPGGGGGGGGGWYPGGGGGGGGWYPGGGGGGGLGRRCRCRRYCRNWERYAGRCGYGGGFGGGGGGGFGGMSRHGGHWRRLVLCCRRRFGPYG